MHFQPSLGWKGTKQEPKTTFPLNFFSVAIHDFSAISLVRAKIFSTVSRKKKSNLHRGVKCKTTWLHVCGKTSHAKRHCYVKSYLRPRTYIKLKFFVGCFDAQSLTPIFRVFRSMDQSYRHVVSCKMRLLLFQ